MKGELSIYLLCAVAAGELWSASIYRVPEDLQGKATFLAKADGVIAGLAVADLVGNTETKRCLPAITVGKAFPATDIHTHTCSWDAYA